MNVPFAPVRGLLGTDYMKVRSDFRRMPNPYDPREEIAVVPALAPDVAVFHGFRGDRFGNVVVSGTTDAKLIAQASRRAVATVEEVTDDDLAAVPHAGVLVPGIHLDAVAHVPRGAHPTACADLYDVDGDHLREYIQAAAADDTFAAYLRHYVLDTRDHAQYLDRVRARALTGAGSR